MSIIILIHILVLPYNFNNLAKDVQASPQQNLVGDTRTDSIPLWVKQLYETKNSAYLNDAIPSVTFFKKFSDSISYCIYDFNNGVCQITFVATQKNRQKYKLFEIGNECDQDFANPEYSSTSYEHNPVKASFVVTTDMEKAKPQYLVKDKTGTIFKEGYDMENAETTSHSIIKSVQITQSGNIITKDKAGQ
jgi:hypothetical protein